MNDPRYSREAPVLESLFNKFDRTATSKKNLMLFGSSNTSVFFSILGIIYVVRMQNTCVCVSGGK